MRPSTAIVCALAVLSAGAVASAQSPGRPSRQASASSARQAAHQPESLPAPNRAGLATETITTAAPEVYYDGNPDQSLLASDPAFCGPDGCSHCGRFGAAVDGACVCGVYVRAEYLLWSTRGMNLPPLVTTSSDDTDLIEAGVLGLDTTRILFGAERVNSDGRSGGRITMGWWLEPCRRLAIEGDYFRLAEESEGFDAESDGSFILARPFFDVSVGEPSASIVAFDGEFRGEISTEAETRVEGGGARFLYNLACGDSCGMTRNGCAAVPTGYRFDLHLGWRTLRVRDRVTVVENTVSLSTADPGTFLIRDEFDTDNEFHGIDIGSSLSFCKGCWSLDLLSKIALGNTRSQIEIDGSTIFTTPNGTETFTGGLLAQRTNIGVREFDEFAVAPELGIMAGYQVNPCWRVTMGYTFLYLSRVARAGDQISLDIDSDLIPPEEGDETDIRPAFGLCYDDFWAQGFTVGLEGSW